MKYTQPIKKLALWAMPKRLAAIAGFGLLSVVLTVEQTAEAQGTPSDFAAPRVFQAAGPKAASLEGAVDAYRRALGNPNNLNNPGPLASGRREIN